MTALAVDPKPKDFLTADEIKTLLAAAKEGRNPVRNYCMIMLIFRHGLRVSEACKMLLRDLNLQDGTLYIRRIKNSLSTTQPIGGEELRAIRAWLRERSAGKWPNSKYLFTGPHGSLQRFAVNRILKVLGKETGIDVCNPHALRHGTGYHLANSGQDSRLIQDYLGHKNATNTARYTRTNPKRFERLFD